MRLLRTAVAAEMLGKNDYLSCLSLKDCKTKCQGLASPTVRVICGCFEKSVCSRETPKPAHGEGLEKAFPRLDACGIYAKNPGNMNQLGGRALGLPVLSGASVEWRQDRLDSRKLVGLAKWIPRN